MRAQHSVGAHHESDLVQDRAGELVQQRGQKRPISRGEPYSRAAQLPFQDGQLVAEGTYKARRAVRAMRAATCRSRDLALYRVP